MSFGLFLPRRWTRQPQGPVEVDWGHPLSSNLVCAFVAGAPGFMDLTTGQSLGTGYGSALRPKVFGRAGAATQAYGYDSLMQKTVSPMFKNNGQIELFSIAERRANATRAISSGGPADSYVALSGSDYLISGGFTNAASVRINMVGTRPMPLRQPFSVSLVSSQPAGGSELWVDGRLDGQTTETIWGDTQPDRFRPVAYDANDSAIVVYASYGWQSQLTRAARLALHENPWQLLRPRRPILYSFPSGGITIPTLSLPGVQDITATSARPKVTLTF